MLAVLMSVRGLAAMSVVSIEESVAGLGAITEVCVFAAGASDSYTEWKTCKKSQYSEPSEAVSSYLATDLKHSLLSYKAKGAMRFLPNVLSEYRGF